MTDPFERAVRKESRLRRRAATFESRAGMFRVVRWFFGGLAVAWAIVLGLHWAFFAEPRWLVIIHTLGFVLLTGYWAMAMLFVRFMMKRRPDWFENDDE